MKSFVLLLILASFGFAQDHDGNFHIRFAPDAELQTKVDIPFDIHVMDDRGKPVDNARVTLQIETPEHTQVQVFNAPYTDHGLYIAKPVFPKAGQWHVYVEVHQNGLMSARTIDFNVPVYAAP